MIEAAAIGSGEFGRVRWHCRRGMKELDVLLSRYAEAHYLASSPAERATFRQLLESEDGLIYAYCFGYQVPSNADVAALIQRITSVQGNHQ